MTPDQRALLEDKLALWRQASEQGNMGSRDYNRRCADALEAALAPIPAQPDTTALREALEPFARWARWALETHPAICNDRKFRDVPGMLRNADDEWAFGQQLSPDEPRLRLKHFRAALATLSPETPDA